MDPLFVGVLLLMQVTDNGLPAFFEPAGFACFTRMFQFFIVVEVTRGLTHTTDFIIQLRDIITRGIQQWGDVVTDCSCMDRVCRDCSLSVGPCKFSMRGNKQVINPRRACARVTVLGLCVCLSIWHHESSHYAQLSIQLKVPTASAQAGKHFKYGVFSKNASFKSYGVIYIPGSVRPF